MNLDVRTWSIVLLLLAALLVYLLQPILPPFLIAALLAYLGDPLADRLEARGLGRTLAVVIVFLFISLVLAILLLLLIPLIGSQVDLLIQKLPTWVARAQQSLLPWLQQSFNLSADALPISQLTAALKQHWAGAGNIALQLSQQLANSGMALVALAVNLALIPVVTFYLLRDWDVLVQHLRDMLPRRFEATVVGLVAECDEIIGAFIRGQLLVMFTLGLIYSIGLSIVGLDLAILLGMVAGLASIVPYLGVIVGLLASTVAAYFQFQEWLPLAWVALVFGIGQLLEGMILTPLLVGDKIGLHPVAVIFAVLAGGQLAGFAGVLLALPVAAVVMVLLRHLHHNYKGSDWYHQS